jgi:hypothetical protein
MSMEKGCDVYSELLSKLGLEFSFDGSFELHERSVWGSDNRFSEHFLQIVWNERHLVDDPCCLDGSSLRIVHQGTWNLSSGPDFRDAALVIGGRLVRGDVEIHQRTMDWQRHGHGDDPAYSGVVLHVVWEHDGIADRSPESVLELRSNLHPAWRLLLREVEDACYPYSKRVPPGRCSLRWALTDDAKVKEILAVAGMTRFSSKASRIARLAVEHGLDETLYRLFFECLGYKSNREQFLALSYEHGLDELREIGDELGVMSVLYGSSGLLLDPSRHEVLPQWRERSSEMWHRWWVSGGGRLGVTWNLSGCRPLNSPHRRLAAGVSWLIRVGFRPSVWLCRVVGGCVDGRGVFKALLSELDLDLPPWRECQSFQKSLKAPAALLGKKRIVDILANVLLPALYDKTLPGYDPKLAHLVSDAYLRLPPSQENRLLTEAIHRFLTPPSRAVDVIDKTCHQQGLIDIYRNFCQLLHNDCSRCPFGNGE